MKIRIIDQPTDLKSLLIIAVFRITLFMELSVLFLMLYMNAMPRFF